MAEKISQTALGRETSPFIYFDAVPVCGIRNGVLQLELVAVAPKRGEKGVDFDIISTAHLRCGRDAAKQLADSINQMLKTESEIASRTLEDVKRSN